MKKLSLILFAFISFSYVLGQAEADKNYLVSTVAFYNVENLFDTINDPLTWDDDRTPEGKDKWTNTIYNKKLLNISKVINDIGSDLTGSSPTIIGLCEVENRKVLKDLINTKLLINSNYGIIHYDSKDERGVDVAMLYKKKRFKPIHTKKYPLTFKRKDGSIDYTRDHLVISGYLDNDKIYLIINHWPSRSGGQMKSEKKRILAGKLNRKIIDSIFHTDQNAKIINMGDFNDNPGDKSIKPVLRTIIKKNEIKNNQLYNPTEELFKMGYGTYKYKGKWFMLDQFMISKNLVDKKNGLFFLKASVFNKKYTINPGGKYEGYPFKSFAGGKFLNGYSDHFPIYLYLAKKF